MERQTAGAPTGARFDECFTTLRFQDGLTVSLLRCPRLSLARLHWHKDGSCDCDSAEKAAGAEQAAA